MKVKEFRRRLRIAVVALTALLLTLAAGCGSSSTPNAGNIDLASAPDATETALQGQVPLSDQLNGRSAQGYRKGVRLIGQNTVLDRGANFNLAWVGDCAYVTTVSVTGIFLGTPAPYITFGLVDDPLNGMAVIDAADAAHPRLTEIDKSSVMLRTHESLQGNDARRIVVATSVGAATAEVWDASDCAHPVLRGSVDIGASIPLMINGNNFSQGVTFRGHALCLSDDGRTAYAMGTPYSNAVLDLEDINHPSVLTTFIPAAHDCGLSPDGNRLYLAVFGGVVFGTAGTLLSLATANLLGTENFNGLLILDVSEFNRRLPNPQFHVVGQLPWTDNSESQTPGGGAHTLRWFQSGGRTYLYSSDEWPIIAMCPWTHGRILDITDEAHPVKVTDITLAVQQGANCVSTELDLANYSMHYVGVDDVHNATTLFISAYTAGLRVFDIRDVARPTEIAYYHPTPNPNVNTLTAPGGLAAYQGLGQLWDAVPSYVRYRPESGQIWIASATAGFQILELTQSAGPTAPRPTGR